VLRVLGDQSLFIAASAAYASMRLVLFFTGHGRLMYGSRQFALLANPLNVATGYTTVASGFWWESAYTFLWPVLLKVAIVLCALVVVVLLVRWLGKIGVFAVGWFVITLLLTLEDVALRWFYLPALGVGIFIAAIWDRLRGDLRRADEKKVMVPRWRRALVFVPLLFVVWFGWQTIVHNEQWQESGEVARGLLAQVKQLHPNPALPATFYVANPPYSYKEVLLFNTGLDSAMSMIYHDWTNIQGYSTAEDDAQVNAALADPSKLGPNPIFLRYENGKMVDYPSLRALVNAGK